jgi:hypothetical protein
VLVDACVPSLRLTRHVGNRLRPSAIFGFLLRLAQHALGRTALDRFHRASLDMVAWLTLASGSAHHQPSKAFNPTPSGTAPDRAASIKVRFQRQHEIAELATGGELAPNKSSRPVRAASSWDRACRPCERSRCWARFSCRCPNTSRIRLRCVSRFPALSRQPCRGSAGNARSDHRP